ncbi:hypothetical protein CLOSTMETH_03527 [[Clostridium] methylpentosum DSM 5476]|uniref:Uncharacterized protein n=1 Tax=[Clostridium] methylpentosum DSM 5476 TaxID=537013 RepID=C0EI32_9FIRM|nr:hypothetical protein CLOSTMETH_03527 [[Clostridium] methylpentosum DSM 5476]
MPVGYPFRTCVKPPVYGCAETTGCAGGEIPTAFMASVKSDLGAFWGSPSFINISWYEQTIIYQMYTISERGAATISPASG